MCGIIGVIGKTNSVEIKSLLKPVWHRGNKHNELLVFENGGIGVNRLPIVDPKKGKQPFFNESKTIFTVMNGEIFRVYDSNGRFITKGNGSYAKGGMANVWGAQLLKYNKKDLDEVNGWPISINELEAYYTELEDHIGISGVNDDMSQFLGESDNLLPPVELSIIIY